MDETGELSDFSKDPTVIHSGTVDYMYAFCPHEGCGKKNWVYLGDMSDITAPDREVLRCYACDKLSWLSAEIRDEASVMGYDSIEDAFDERGEATPPV